MVSLVPTEFLNELRKINLPRDKFAIAGSGPLAAAGIRKCNDLDLIVTLDLWDELAKKYPVINERGGIIKIGNIEIYKEYPPFDNIPELIEEANIVDGFRFVKLKRLFLWKKTGTREKDQKDVELIEKFLNQN